MGTCTSVCTIPLGQRIWTRSTRLRWPQAEVHPQIVLREIAAAAAHLLDLH